MVPKDAVLVKQARAWVGPKDYRELVARTRFSRASSRRNRNNEMRPRKSSFRIRQHTGLADSSSLGFVLDGLLPPYRGKRRSELRLPWHRRGGDLLRPLAGPVGMLLCVVNPLKEFEEPPREVTL
jgi:hypothetical protein